MGLFRNEIIEQPLTPSVYEVVEQTTQQTTVLDVLFGSCAVIGVVAVCGLVLGGLFGGVKIWLANRADRKGLDERNGVLLGLNRKE